MVHLIIVYRKKQKFSKPVWKTPGQCGLKMLQASLDGADCNVFRTAMKSFDEYKESVMSYISFCEDS